VKIDQGKFGQLRQNRKTHQCHANHPQEATEGRLREQIEMLSSQQGHHTPHPRVIE
jgi:hypothetical protein